MEEIVSHKDFFPLFGFRLPGKTRHLALVTWFSHFLNWSFVERFPLKLDLVKVFLVILSSIQRKSCSCSNATKQTHFVWGFSRTGKLASGVFNMGMWLILILGVGFRVKITDACQNRTWLKWVWCFKGDGFMFCEWRIANHSANTWMPWQACCWEWFLIIVGKLLKSSFVKS